MAVGERVAWKKLSDGKICTHTYVNVATQTKLLRKKENPSNWLNSQHGVRARLARPFFPRWARAHTLRFASLASAACPLWRVYMNTVRDYGRICERQLKDEARQEKRQQQQEQKAKRVHESISVCMNECLRTCQLAAITTNAMPDASSAVTRTHAPTHTHIHKHIAAPIAPHVSLVVTIDVHLFTAFWS